MNNKKLDKLEQLIKELDLITHHLHLYANIAKAMGMTDDDQIFQRFKSAYKAEHNIDIADILSCKILTNLQQQIRPASTKVHTKAVTNGFVKRLNATAVGELLGISAAGVNQILVEQGYTIKDEDGYHLTDKGFRAGGKPYQATPEITSVSWTEAIADELEPYVQAYLDNGGM